MLSELVTYLNTELNAKSVGGLDFNVTALRQKYEHYLKTADDTIYIPCIIELESQPILIDDVGIKTSIYTIQFHVRRTMLTNLDDTIKALVNGGTFTVGTETAVIYYGGLDVTEFNHDAQGYAEQTAEVYLQFQVNLIKGSVASNSTKIELKTSGSYIQVPYTTVTYKNEKGLVPNVAYGTNNSSKLVSEEYVITFPIVTTNTMLTSLIADIMSDTYNTKYTMKHTITGSIIKEMDVVTRAGGFTYLDNAQPITFWVTFERALPRKTITIDTVSLPLANLTYGFTGDVIVGKVNDGVYGINVPNGQKTLTATIFYTANEKDTELINEINRTTRNTSFAISYEVGSITYTGTYTMVNGSISVLENGDISYTITMGKKS